MGICVDALQDGVHHAILQIAGVQCAFLIMQIGHLAGFRDQKVGKKSLPAKILAAFHILCRIGKNGRISILNCYSSL